MAMRWRVVGLTGYVLFDKTRETVGIEKPVAFEISSSVTGIARLIQAWQAKSRLGRIQERQLSSAIVIENDFYVKLREICAGGSTSYAWPRYDRPQWLILCALRAQKRTTYKMASTALPQAQRRLRAACCMLQ